MLIYLDSRLWLSLPYRLTVLIWLQLAANASQLLLLYYVQILQIGQRVDIIKVVVVETQEVKLVAHAQGIETT